MKTHQDCISASVIALLTGAASAQVSIDVVAYDGPPPPGFPDGVHFKHFWHAANTRAGVAAFEGAIAGDGVDGFNQGVVWSNEAGLVLLLRTGDEAPGAQGAAFFGFHDISTGAGTSIAVDAALVDNRDGLWKRTNGQFELVALEGETAPGFGVPATFGNFNVPVLLDNGDAYFRSNVVINQNSIRTIYTDQGEGLTLLHKQTDPAGDDGPFTTLDIVDVNHRGQILIEGAVASGEGLWIGADGEVTHLLMEGDDAPGWDDAVIVALNSGGINELGHVVLRALTASPSQYWGAFARRDGELEAVFVHGEPAPMTEPGTVFIQAAGVPQLNDLGQIVFRATVYGPDVPNEATGAIWLDDGDVTMLYRRADPLRDAPDGALLDTGGVIRLNNAGDVVMSTHVFGEAVDGDTDKILIGFSLYEPEPYTILRESDELVMPCEVVGGISDAAAQRDVRIIADFEMMGDLTDSGRVLVWIEFTDGAEALVQVQLGGSECLADFNDDGDINILDFVAFQQAFVNRDPKADCNDDGQYQILDFICFQTLVDAGCK